MSDYTPQTDEVEEAYIGYYTHSDATRINPVLQREFNRWLAAHDKEVLEAAVMRVHLATGEPYGWQSPLEFTEVYDAIRGEFINSYPPAAARGGE